MICINWSNVKVSVFKPTPSVLSTFLDRNMYTIGDIFKIKDRDFIRNMGRTSCKRFYEFAEKVRIYYDRDTYEWYPTIKGLDPEYYLQISKLVEPYCMTFEEWSLIAYERGKKESVETARKILIKRINGMVATHESVYGDEISIDILFQNKRRKHTSDYHIERGKIQLV